MILSTRVVISCKAFIMRNFLILLTIVFCTSLSAQELKLDKYSENGISCDFPADWIKEAQKNGDVLFYPIYDFSAEKPFGVAISQVKEINSEESSMQAYLTLTLSSLKRFQHANITKNEIQEINGVKAYMYEYEIKNNEKHEVGRLIVLRKGDKAYQITIRGTFRSYMDYRMFAEFIVTSFTIE